ncbi:hypothetical protein, partial [Klebsiella pneumoniae]
SSQTQLNAEPVAEYSLAMIILAAKGIFASRRRYLENRAKEETFWGNFPDVGLYGADRDHWVVANFAPGY